MTIHLSSSTSYVVHSDYASATVTIYDDDLPTVSVVATSPDATESGTPGQFTVSLQDGEATPQPVTLPYDLLVAYTLSGTAANGVAYQMLPGDVIIPAGQSSATIPINPLDQNIIGGSQDVVLTLASGGGYNLAGSCSATVTTQDDDSDLPRLSIYPTAPFASGTADGQVTVVSSQAPPSGGLDVSVNVGGTTETATIAQGQTSTTVSIPPGARQAIQARLLAVDDPR